MNENNFFDVDCEELIKCPHTHLVVKISCQILINGVMLGSSGCQSFYWSLKGGAIPAACTINGRAAECATTKWEKLVQRFYDIILIYGNIFYADRKIYI